MVNNAGIMLNGDIQTTTEEQFDRSMNVNVKSAFLITKTAIPHLEKSQVKSIVNVSSIAGLRAYPGAISYKISKAAMDQLTRYGVFLSRFRVGTNLSKFSRKKILRVRDILIWLLFN